MRDIPWHAVLLLSYLVSRLRITVPASSIMKVKSGTRRRVLGREPGRWSMFGFAIIWFPAGNARRIQRNSDFWTSGVCVWGGEGVYRKVHGTECMFALASHWPFPGFCGTCCISWIKIVLFFPLLGKPHHFQTVPSVCAPLSHSPVIFSFPDSVPTLRSHSLTFVCT